LDISADRRLVPDDHARLDDDARDGDAALLCCGDFVFDIGDYEEIGIRSAILLHPRLSVMDFCNIIYFFNLYLLKDLKLFEVSIILINFSIDKAKLISKRVKKNMKIVCH